MYRWPPRTRNTLIFIFLTCHWNTSCPPFTIEIVFVFFRFVLSLGYFMCQVIAVTRLSSRELKAQTDCQRIETEMIRHVLLHSILHLTINRFNLASNVKPKNPNNNTNGRNCSFFVSDRYRNTIGALMLCAIDIFCVLWTNKWVQINISAKWEEESSSKQIESERTLEDTKQIKINSIKRRKRRKGKREDWTKVIKWILWNCVYDKVITIIIIKLIATSNNTYDDSTQIVRAACASANKI